MLVKKAGLWCNGNTTVFGAVFLGSSPSRPTESPSEMKGFFYFKNLSCGNKKNSLAEFEAREFFVLMRLLSFIF